MHPVYAGQQQFRRFGNPGGPSAMIGSEIRQARKGATVVADSCAGVWLSGLPPFRRYIQ